MGQKQHTIQGIEAMVYVLLLGKCLDFIPGHGADFCAASSHVARFQILIFVKELF